MISGNLLWQDKITLPMIHQEINHRSFYTFESMPHNLYQMLQETAEKLPNHIALVDNDNIKYSYQNLLSLVDSFSSYLVYEKKISKGNHVALMMYNSIEYCVAFISLSKIGAVAVPLPSKYKVYEITSLISKADVEFIIYEDHFESYFTQNLPESIVLIPSKKQDNKYGFSYINYSLLPTCTNNGQLEDPALIMFTSGTTSQSKGVLIKNYNIGHAILSYQQILNITKEDISIIPTPIYHITGLIALLGLFVYVGGCLYLHRRFDAKKVLNCVKENKITFIHASPTVFTLLLEERQNYPQLSSLKSFACGSSNMPIERLKELHDWLPHTSFHTVYGLTETTSPGTIFPEDASTSKYIGSSGIPIPGLEIKIIEENGQEVDTNKVGEILVRGTVVIEEYYKNNNNSIDQDGWLYTGDLGYLNSDHFLYIVDRKKDMINRGGEKVWSFDVENELCKIKGILEAAVVGISDPTYGEVPVAIIRTSQNFTKTCDDIYEILKDKLATFQIPQNIIFIDSIPKTTSGKVDKKHIRQLFKKEMEDFTC